MISFFGINWLAVILGTILSMALGALWYGPLFGQLWLKMIEKSADELEADPMDYLKTSLAAFAAMVVLNAVVVTLGASGFLTGLTIGGCFLSGLERLQRMSIQRLRAPRRMSGCCMPPTSLCSSWSWVVYLRSGKYNRRADFPG